MARTVAGDVQFRATATGQFNVRRWAGPNGYVPTGETRVKTIFRGPYSSAGKARQYAIQALQAMSFGDELIDTQVVVEKGEVVWSVVE